jgi:hypothetical protein
VGEESATVIKTKPVCFFETGCSCHMLYASYFCGYEEQREEAQFVSKWQMSTIEATHRSFVDSAYTSAVTTYHELAAVVAQVAIEAADGPCTIIAFGVMIDACISLVVNQSSNHRMR